MNTGLTVSVQIYLFKNTLGLIGLIENPILKQIKTDKIIEKNTLKTFFFKLLSFDKTLMETIHFQVFLQNISSNRINKNPIFYLKNWLMVLYWERQSNSASVLEKNSFKKHTLNFIKYDLDIHIFIFQNCSFSFSGVSAKKKKIWGLKPDILCF